MAATLVTTIKRFIGTSAERATLVVVGIPAGSTFFETDTGLLYLLSSAGTWSLKKPALQTELIASIGAKTDVAVVNPSLDSSEISLLKGLLSQLQGTGLNKTTVEVSDSTIQQPVEMQSRFTDIIQTHNAVSVGASATSFGSYIQCVNDLSGAYSKLAVTVQNSGATSTTVKIRWSNDGLTDNGEETILAAGTDQLRAGEATVKGRFARLAITNGHTAAVTISAWALLQA